MKNDIPRRERRRCGGGRSTSMKTALEMRKLCPPGLYRLGDPVSIEDHTSYISIWDTLDAADMGRTVVMSDCIFTVISRGMYRSRTEARKVMVGEGTMGWLIGPVIRQLVRIDT